MKGEIYYIVALDGKIDIY